MSNAKKWWRKMAVAFGARDGGDRRTHLPSFDESPSYWTVFAGFVVLIVLLVIS
jgi:hypothetical protein